MPESIQEHPIKCPQNIEQPPRLNNSIQNYLADLTRAYPQHRTALHYRYNAKPIHQSKPWDLVKQGLAMVPEGRGVFTRMTIIENLLMGAYSRNDGADIDEDMERIFTTFPRLKERSHQLAGTLSGGEQQMLAMGRALMSRPSLLLLDEPSMGLSPLMVDKIFEVIQAVSAQGVTIVLVEQNASRALQIAQRAYVMESGVITLSGKAGDLLHDPKVRAAYLGE